MTISDRCFEKWLKGWTRDMSIIVCPEVKTHLRAAWNAGLGYGQQEELRRQIRERKEAQREESNNSKEG